MADSTPDVADLYRRLGTVKNLLVVLLVVELARALGLFRLLVALLSGGDAVGMVVFLCGLVLFGVVFLFVRLF